MIMDVIGFSVLMFACSRGGVSGIVYRIPILKYLKGAIDQLDLGHTYVYQLSII